MLYETYQLNDNEVDDFCNNQDPADESKTKDADFWKESCYFQDNESLASSSFFADTSVERYTVVN